MIDGRRRHEPAPRQADRPHPPRPAGARQGAQLPLPGRRAPQPRATRRSRRCCASGRTLPAGWQYPRRVRGAHRPRASGSTSRRASERLCAPDGVPARGPGRHRGRDRGLLHARRCRGPTRGRSSRRSASCSTPSPSASGSSSRGGAAARCSAIDGSRRARATRRVVGRARLPAPDRPRPARPARAQDAQPPVLERDRGGRGSCCARPSRRARRARTRPRTRTGRSRGRSAPPTRRRPRPRSGSPASTLPKRRSSPASRAGSRRTSRLLLENALESMDTPLAELADALERFRHSGVEEQDLSQRHPDGPAGRADPALPDRPARVRQHREANTSRSRTSTSCASTSCSRRSSHGRLGGKAAGLFLAAQILALLAGVRGRCSARSACRADLVPPLGRDPRLHRLQRPRRRLQPQVPGPRPGPAGVPPHRPALQELALPARDRAWALGRRSTTSRTGRSSCAARACSRTALGSAFSGKYKSLFLANQGSKRERLRALIDAIAEVYASVFGPDPIQYRARARAPRPARGDGHHDPGGGRDARGSLLPAGVLRRRLQPQRVPLVAAHQARGRAAAPRARPRHAGGRPPGRRLPGAGRAGPAGAARQPDGRRGRALLAQKADVINLETGVFETVDMRELLERFGDQLPLVRQWSRSPTRTTCAGRSGSSTSRSDEIVLTFEGLVSDSPFVARMRTLLQAAAGEARDARGHRVRLRRARPLPAAVPAAERAPKAPRRSRSRATSRRSRAVLRRAATSRTAGSPTSPTSSTSTPTPTRGSSSTASGTSGARSGG